MVDTPSSATSTYGEGVKWILAIATAAIAGAFVHLSEIKQESIGVQGFVGLSLSHLSTQSGLECIIFYG